MDVVDVVLVVAVVAAAVHGLRLGALVQLLTFGGFWLGLTLGALLAAAIASSVHSTDARTTIALLLVVGLAVVLGLVGSTIGLRTHAVVRRAHLASVDAALGVAVAVVAVLLSAWLLATVLSQSRSTWLDSQIERSTILRGVDAVMPPVPDVFAHVQAFLAGTGFPPVFIQLAPPAANPVPAPPSAAVEALGDKVAASTVKIEGEACGYLQEGSGFVVAPGMVVTNAHVVAGESATELVENGNTYPATPVLFDPSFDLAVLRTKAPLGPPLTLDPQTVGRGTQGAVVGYPNDGPLAITGAGVAANLTAVGRDIYNEGVVTRQVYQLDANVQPGNSGGPVVATSGSVIGVVFSRSTVQASVGYALTSPGVLTRVQQAEQHTSGVATGACVQG